MALVHFRLSHLVFILFLTQGSFAFSQETDFSQFDGKRFGADGLPLDCNSSDYNHPTFAGNGNIICNLAKEVDQTVILVNMTAMTAVILKQGAFCGFRLSEVGAKALQGVNENFPKTWKIVREHIEADARWGQLNKSDCSKVKLADSAGVFQY